MPTTRTLTLIKKLGDTEIEITDTTELGKLTITSNGTGNEERWTISETTKGFFAEKGFKEKNAVIAEWQEVNTPAVGSATPTNYKAIKGVYSEAGNKVEDLQKIKYAINLSAELEIKEPGAQYAAAEIRVMVGNHVPRHPQGDWVIQQLAGDPSYIDVIAIMNWIKGQDAHARDLALPAAPDSVSSAAIISLSTQPYLNYLYDNKEAIFKAANDIIETAVNAVTDADGKTTARNTAQKQAIADAAAAQSKKKALDALSTELAAHIDTHIAKLTQPANGSTAEQTDAFNKQKKDVIKKEASLFCAKLSVKLEENMAVPAGEKEEAKKIRIKGYKEALAKLAAEAINKTYTTSIISASDLVINSLDRYRVEFHDFSINMTKKLFTVDLGSHDGDQVQFGAFTLKKIGLFVSNDPDYIKIKYPQLADDEE